MALTDDQKAEVRRLAVAGKSGKLDELARNMGAPFTEVARYYADCARELSGDQSPRPATRPPLQELTESQRQIIRRLAADGDTAKLVVLAEDWGVDSRVISRFYADCRAALTKREVINPQPVALSPTVPTAADLVANVVATPGQIAVIPRPWPLIAARLESKYTARDIAIAAGMAVGDYTRIEDGRQLPTADQAAKICALLHLNLAETFAVAAEAPLFTKGAARGLSLLGILRARLRVNLQQLATAIREETGTDVSSHFLGQIERGAVRQPLTTNWANQIEAIAAYFRVSSSAIMAQVPPAWIASAGQNIAAMHRTLLDAYQALEAPAVDPVLALTGGDLRE